MNISQTYSTGFFFWKIENGGFKKLIIFLPVITQHKGTLSVMTTKQREGEIRLDDGRSLFLILLNN